jgi:hypothetical protein
MPIPISSYYGASSYATAYGATSRTRAAASVGLSGTSSEGDTVEISSSDGSSSGSGASGDVLGTYGPQTFSDRFRFDIEHGMLDNRLRFDPLSVRFRGVATSTYRARQSVAGQVGSTARGAGVSTAMFELLYQDAQPSRTSATSSVEALNELNRMLSQNLGLLSTL